LFGLCLLASGCFDHSVVGWSFIEVSLSSVQDTGACAGCCVGALLVAGLLGCLLLVWIGVFENGIEWFWREN
jgi:hypothetical protein